MKIQCHCGQPIVDQSDELPGKAHLIPDQDWFGLFDDIDNEVIDGLKGGGMQQDGAYMVLRTLINRAARSMWQCSACGRLYVDDSKGQTHCFRPEAGGGSTSVLGGGDQ